MVVDIKVFAYTVPAICIVMGALLIVAHTNSDATTCGGNLNLIRDLNTSIIFDYEICQKL